MNLPLTIDDMRRRLGALKTLPQVRSAQETVSEWVVEAALRAYPHMLAHGSMDAALQTAYLAACERWHGFEDFAASLTQAERDALAASGPMA